MAGTNTVVVLLVVVVVGLVVGLVVRGVVVLVVNLGCLGGEGSGPHVKSAIVNHLVKYDSNNKTHSSTLS